MSRDAYWVYENAGVNRVRVHRASCAHCRDGSGRREGMSVYGRWHGPFGNRADAFAVATAMGRADTKACPTCGP